MFKQIYACLCKFILIYPFIRSQINSDVPAKRARKPRFKKEVLQALNTSLRQHLDHSGSLRVLYALLPRLKGIGGVLILAKYKEEVALFAEFVRLLKLINFVVTGDTPVGTRDIIVQEMKNGDLEALIATIDVAGEGLSLPTVKVVIVVSIDSTPGSFMQMSNRTSRLGGKRKPVVIVITPNTEVTNKKLELVLQRKEVNARLLDALTDHYTSIFPEEVSVKKTKGNGCWSFEVQMKPPFVGSLLWHNGSEFVEVEVGKALQLQCEELPEMVSLLMRPHVANLIFIHRLSSDWMMEYLLRGILYQLRK